MRGRCWKEVNNLAQMSILQGGLTPLGYDIDRGVQRRLLLVFWLSVAALFLFVLTLIIANPSSGESFLGAALIAFAALIPRYLWCSGRALGIPIFPIFALTHLWTCALPLLTSHPAVAIYPASNQLSAALTVGGFLILGTIIWYQCVKSPSRSPSSYRYLEGSRADWFFLLALTFSIFFFAGTQGSWFTLAGGVFSLMRAVVLGLNALAVFVLAYRWGRGELSKKKRLQFLSLITIYMIIDAAFLLIVGALSTFMLASIAFTLGSRRLPRLPIFLALICLIPLHYGKGPMREKYAWWFDKQQVLQPWDYPAYFIEWAGYSIDALSNPDSTVAESRPFTERIGTIHLLLMAQERAGKDVPYLQGSTYKIIPMLLIPRFFYPEKPASHEGTYLLNIHYGLQTREDTATTTIGWGLLNEAYANFGLIGCACLAIILGTAYGLVARWSMNVPVLSARFLFGVLMMSMAFQSEFSASVYVTALFQYSVPLIVITHVMMSIHRREVSQVLFKNSKLSLNR